MRYKENEDIVFVVMVTAYVTNGYFSVHEETCDNIIDAVNIFNKYIYLNLTKSIKITMYRTVPEGYQSPTIMFEWGDFESEKS